MVPEEFRDPTQWVRALLAESDERRKKLDRLACWIAIEGVPGQAFERASHVTTSGEKFEVPQHAPLQAAVAVAVQQYARQQVSDLCDELGLPRPFSAIVKDTTAHEAANGA